MIADAQGQVVEEVRALISGAHPALRQRWRYMALQAYVDESASDGKTLVIAGYIATVPQWEAFSVEWEQHVRGAPFFSQFKMKEHTDARDMERVEWLYRVIERNVGAAVCCAVDVAALADLVPKFGLPQLAANPYLFAVEAILRAAANLSGEAEMEGPIDFIFDERSEQRRIQEAWTRDKLIVDHPKYVTSMPIFRDDRKFLPLQAADLLAFWVRRFWDQHYHLRFARGSLFPWPMKRGMDYLTSEWGQNRLIIEMRNVQKKFTGLFFAIPYTTTVRFYWNGKRLGA